MSERDSYPHGVPCWVDTAQPDPEAALRFYRDVFGWDFEGPGDMPGDPPGRYFVARVRGRDVAGVSSEPPKGPSPTPAWNTYLRVDNADRATEAVSAAGGQVLTEPFDAPPAGRMAVLVDPAGATFCVWEADFREGAQLVNEPSAWAMSALMTPDPEGAKEFYGAVFGWETDGFDMGGAPVWMWRLAGYVGGEPEQPVPRDVVAMMFGTAEGPASWRPDFWIADVDRAAASATGGGGSVLEAPADVPGVPMRAAVVADPTGATFSLTQLMTEA